MLRKNLLLISSISIVILGIVVGLEIYSYFQIEISLTDLSSVEIRLVSLSITELTKIILNSLSGEWVSSVLSLIDDIVLGLDFELSNKGLFPIYIPDLTYDLSINGIFVGQGFSKIDSVINPGETKDLKVFQTLKKSNLSPAIKSIIQTNGVVDVKINGTGFYDLFGTKIPLHFESQKEISLIDEIEKQISLQQ